MFIKGGIPWNKGKVGVQKHSEETKKKISKNNARFWKGKKMSKERIEKNRLSHLGIRTSEETKKKISNALKGKLPKNFYSIIEKARKVNLGNTYRRGKTHSPEAKLKMSNTRKELYKNKENHPMWKGGISTYDRKLYLNLRRRSLKENAEGTHTFIEWELMKKQYRYICPCCNEKEPEIKLTQDHIIPLSKGGSDYIENIQPLCRNCNSKKHTDTIKY